MKLLLVDGFYYAYRSFHAIPDLTNSRGEPTGAVYGFLKALRRMQRDLAPAYAAVVWDEGLPERRTSLQPAYKAQRSEMPEALSAQLECMRKMIGLLGFSSVSLPGTEADDLMASYAHAAKALGIEAILATNDKDLFQILDDGIQIYSTNKTDLASPQDSFALLNEDAVLRKWGVLPQQLGDVLSLVGDTSDNIPGVPGVGPKGAATLISKHGDMHGVYASLDTLSDKLREKLLAAREQVFQNREMVRLDMDLPLPKPVSELKISPQFPELLEALAHCEFRSLLAEMSKEAPRLPSLQQGELFG